MVEQYFVKRVDNRTIVVVADYDAEQIFVDFFAQKSIIDEPCCKQTKANTPIENYKVFIDTILTLIEQARDSFYEKNISFDSVVFFCIDRGESRMRVYKRLLTNAIRNRKSEFKYSQSLFIKKDRVEDWYTCSFTLWH